MKKDIHPEWKETTVTCNGCGATFKNHSITDKITVEICSNCHPFYTGKQKLVDVAGRVDKFKARQAVAQRRRSDKIGVPTKVSEKSARSNKSPSQASDEKMQQLKKELERKTSPISQTEKDAKSRSELGSATGTATPRSDSPAGGSTTRVEAKQ